MKKLILLSIFTSSIIVNVSAQNVGIGVLYPSEKLHVGEPDSTFTRLKVSGGSVSPDGAIIEHVKGSDQINLFSTKGLMQLGVGPRSGLLSPRIRIKPNIGVSIGGTFDPTHTLHLKGSNQLRLEGLTEKTLASDTVLVVDGSGVVKYALKSDLFPSGSGYWSQNSTDDVYYLDSVAIGHNNPLSILDIYHPSDDVHVIAHSAKENTDIQVGVDLYEMKIGQYANNLSGDILNGINKSAKSYIYVPKKLLADPEKAALILANENPSPLIFGTNNEEQMRIDSFGNVGIGMATPSRKLEVNGDILANDSLLLGSGNMGLRKAGSAISLFSDGSSLRMDPGVNQDIQIHGSNSPFFWSIFDGSERRLGVNYLSPQKTLHVGGSGMVEDTMYLGDENAYITKLSENIIIESEMANVELRAGGVSKRVGIFADNTQWVTYDGVTKNVGINTASPSHDLTVEGSTFVNDTMYLRNTDNFVGYNASSNSLSIQSDDEIELRPGSNDAVEIYNGGGVWAKFDGGIEQLILSNSLGNPALFVNGKSEMAALQVSGGAVPGYVMVSDGVGNANWAPVPSGSDWTIFGGGSHMHSAVPGNVSVGGSMTSVPPSKLSVEGSISLPLRTINSSDYPYTPSFNEHTIICLDPGGTVNLPAASAAANRVYIIKFDGSGGQLIPLVPSDKIDGLTGPTPVPPSGAINNVTLQSDGVDTWYIIQGNF